MNKIYRYLILPLFITAACTNENVKEKTSEQSTLPAETKPIEEEVIDPNSLFLEGMYASSTQLPLDQFAVENILDGNKDTYWSTMKGAGPDEGFMLYFREETFIKEIKIEKSANKGAAALQSVVIYGNGQSIETFPVSKKILINKPLKSLYVRIKQTDQDEKKQRGDMAFEMEKFNKESFVAISEITITGDKDQVYKIIPPKKMEGSVEASSILNPKIAYHPSQVFDSRKEFVWAEGSAGSGENETLTFHFKEKVNITGIQLWNGFQRSEKHFLANARIKAFEFGTKDNMSAYELQDVQSPQNITLKTPLEGSEFILKVSSVYPGKDYKDLVLSEMRFLNGKKSFIISGVDEEKFITDLQGKSKGTILESILDQRIQNKIIYEGPDDEQENKSLILRSDFTFVVYDNSSSVYESREVVGDGSWELIEANGERAKIRVFGKLVDLSQTSNEYTGTSTSSYLRIFQDYLTIDAKTIKGEKFLSTFHIEMPEME